MEEDNNNGEPILYILMRTDLLSMNPGKAVAHGGHAANQFTYMLDMMRDGEEDQEKAPPHPAIALYDEWIAATGQGFGTTITLGVNDAQMNECHMKARIANLHSGIVFDPTYPLRDGEFTHLIPLNTCAFIFGRKGEVQDIVSELNLMP